MSNQKLFIPGLAWGTILLSALSLSIGWGVRGNWGHEYGAMIPGALSALAVCLLSGREDWRKRAAYFAFFGALGWSFGGSMSYGIVIGYTHSDHFPSALYGFACLFVIGFLWGAIGGVGTTLPALLSQERLREFFPPICAVFVAWLLQEFLDLSGILSGKWFNWFDTDWIAALLALLAVLILAAFRRKLCPASKMILYMAIGWWAAFLILVVGWGIRMTPPRGDNWSGCLGMTIALWIYLYRNGMASAVYISLITALFAGFGFSTAELIKMIGISTGLHANWHSVMEQSFGFISGLGVALGMGYLSTRSTKLSEESGNYGWSEIFCFLFTILLIPYVNIRKNIESIWLPSKVVLDAMYGISIYIWFNLAYLIIAITIIWLAIRHYKSPFPIIPATALGKGQALFLLFLWWIVIGNLSRYLPFDPGRLITEGVIHVNACLCTLLILLYPRETETMPEQSSPNYLRLFQKTFAIGIIIACAAFLIQTAVTLSLFDKADANAHFRFGPKAWNGNVQK